ncbi:MAG: hypothetical protein AB1607_18110 [Chloroflexota bacterium]
MRVKILLYAILIVAIITGCASPQATNEAPSPTTAPTEAPPSTTDITIDGDPSDWERYPVSIADPAGDSTGNVDVKSIRTFINDRFLYLLVEVEGEIGSYVQLDVDFNPGADGWPEFMANAYPNNQDFVPHVARIENQQFNHLQNTTGEVAQGEAFELRFPLDLFGETLITRIQVRVMDGECCESKWVVVDHTEPTQVALVNETDVSQAAAHEPIATPTSAPPVTNVTIDGNTSDWADYLINITDPAGDQASGMADLIEARYFVNDQYLYLLFRIENMEAWDDMAIVGLVGGKGGQLNIRPNKHVNFGYFGESSIDLAVMMEIGEIVEVKIALDQFPAKFEEIHIVSLYNHSKSGNDPVDDSQNGQVKPLKAVKEFEPAPLPGFAPEPAPTRVEFAAQDGHALVGYFYPSWKEDAPVVLLVHQYGLPQNNWLDYGLVDWLQNWNPSGEALGLFPAMPADQSFAVFTLDLRGFGESGPAIPNNVSDEEFNVWGANWVLDIRAAVEQVKSMPGVDASRIAVIGANNGADASVAACEDCLGVLALSAGSYAGLDTKTNAEKLDAEGKVIWCFSTENSQGTDVATCSSISGAHYKWINFTGDGRGMQLIRDDKAPEGIGQNILDFLATVFGFE